MWGLREWCCKTKRRTDGVQDEAAGPGRSDGDAHILLLGVAEANRVGGLCVGVRKGGHARVDMAEDAERSIVKGGSTALCRRRRDWKRMILLTSIPARFGAIVRVGA